MMSYHTDEINKAGVNQKKDEALCLLEMVKASLDIKLLVEKKL